MFLKYWGTCRSVAANRLLNHYRWVVSLTMAILLTIITLPPILLPPNLLPTVFGNQPLHAQSNPQGTGQAVAAGGGSLTAQRIRNRGGQMVVGVLYDYPPFSFLDSDGTVVGFEPDLVRAVAERWNVDVLFVPVTPATRLQSLLAGQIDIVAAALPHSIENETLVDFSTNYFLDSAALLVRTDSSLSGWRALADKTIATIPGNSAVTQVEAVLAENGTTATFLPFQEPATALSAFKAGQADALLGMSAYLSYVVDAQVEPIEYMPLVGSNYIGFGLVPGDPLFRNMVNVTLQAIAAGGTYEEIYRKWFGATEIPLIPTLPGTWPYIFDTLPARLPLQQPAESLSRLAVIRTRGRLLAGVPYDMAPFGFLDAEGRVSGFEIALVHEFARRWLGDADAVDFVRVTPDTAIPLLNAGQVDLVAAALTHNWSHAAAAGFSTTYYEDALGILVRGDDPIRSTADLAEATVATVSGVAGAGGWNETAQLLRAAAAIEPTLLPFQEYRTATQALLAGQVDGLIGSTTVLSETVARHSALRLLPDRLGPQPYGIGTPPFDDGLRDLVNITLQAMQLDGTYAQLYGEWFNGEPYAIALWINEATVPQLTANPLVEMAFLPTSLADTASTRPVIATEAAVDTRSLNGATDTFADRAVTDQATIPTAARMPARTVVPVASTITPLPIRAILVPTATPAPSANATLIADEPVAETRAPVSTLIAITIVTTTVAAATPTTESTPSATVAAPAIPPTPLPLAIHLVRATDSLTSIAREYYGQQAFWPLIYEANREIIGDDPNIIPVGAELIIPAR